MPTLEEPALSSTVTQLLRLRLPEGMRSADIRCERSPLNDSFNLTVRWSSPDGRTLYADQSLDRRELDRLPDSTQADIFARTIESVVANINRVNRDTIEGLITRFGVTPRLPALNRDLQGLAAAQGMQTNQTYANQGMSTLNQSTLNQTYSNQGIGQLQGVTLNDLTANVFGYRVAALPPTTTPKKTPEKPAPEPVARSAWERLGEMDI